MKELTTKTISKTTVTNLLKKAERLAYSADTKDNEYAISVTVSYTLEQFNGITIDFEPFDHICDEDSETINHSYTVNYDSDECFELVDNDNSIDLISSATHRSNDLTNLTVQVFGA